MKKMLARMMTLVLLLACAGASAAEWPEGRSAAKPYSNVPEVKLDETLGYIMLYPSDKLPSALFCNSLEIYLPREDVTVGKGTLTLWEKGEGTEARAVETVAFGDGDRAEVRPLDEEELEGLMWGSGVCVEIRLPVSLEFGKSYYVLMDEGCIVGGDSLPSPAISSAEAWKPELTGDFGVSGLYYTEPKADEAGEDAAAEAPAYALEPKAGDAIQFDLVLGGEAAGAVMYSGNDSAFFETLEYDGSATVTGKVLSDDLQWGVIFLDAQGEVLEILEVEG